MSTTAFTDPNTEAPGAAPGAKPEVFSSPNADIRVDGQRELRRNDAFSKSLDKAGERPDGKKAPVAPGGLTPPTNKEPKGEPKAPVDPIAKANADDAAKKAADKADAKTSKLNLGGRSTALLKEDDEEAEPAAKPELEDKGGKKPDGKAAKPGAAPGDDEAPVTEEEIQEELKTPKSAKSERRFRHLHGQWKAAEAKVAETAKQIAEKDAKLADLEKKMQEAAAGASKAGEIPPDIQKKLDELQMYQRQFELEGSEDVKTRFDARISNQENNIYSTLQTAGIKFKGMDEKQTTEVIKNAGGWRAFARKEPDLVDGILDRLNVADRKEVEAAMMGQTMLEQERKNYINQEKGKAKEYFENQKKEADAAKAKVVPPEKHLEAKKNAIDGLKKQFYGELEMFKDVEIPADASPEEKQRLTAEKKFSQELRDTFAAHIDPQNDQDVIDTAMAATLAHKFKRENTSMKKELKSLRAEIDRIRSGSKTSAKGGALPAAAEPANRKPAPSFGAAIDRAQQNRGSGL